MLFRPGSSKQEGNNKFNWVTYPLARLKIYKEIGSSSLINFLIKISEDATDDWGSHQQKELEFTDAYNSIRRDMPAEILVSAICQPLAAYFDMCNQTISGLPKIRMRHAREIFGTSILVTLMSWQSGDLEDSVTCDFVNYKLGSSIKSSM